MKRFSTKRHVAIVVAAVAVVVLVPAAMSAPPKKKAVKIVDPKASVDYLVTMTNLSPGQPMSPPMAATHAAAGAMWSVGQKSSFALKEIAENGNNAPMYYDLEQARQTGTVYDFAQGVSTQNFPSPIVPASVPGAAKFPQSVSFRIRANSVNNRLSVASMLVCTNDGFTGVDGLELPKAKNASVTVDLQAYDTGTEIENQLLTNMMPPCQGLIGIRSSTGAPGEAVSQPALAENAVISLHAGIKAGVGDLAPLHAWTGPVGRLKVTRLG